jgi:hypothetical protein
MPATPQSEVPGVPSPMPGVPSSPPPAQPIETPPQPQQSAPMTPNTPSAATPAVPEENGRPPRPGAEVSNPGGGQGGVVGEVPPDRRVILSLAALTLTTNTPRPVVGKDVVVVAALEPSLAGARYRLNWGDGSAVETVSELGTHRYAKAKLYKVSASTVVGTSELNREILLQVGSVGPVVPPRVDLLMAVLAGLAACSLIGFVPKLSATCRWGAPGVPEMKLLSREPYLSLSFEPGVRPAEEDITFSKK